MPRGAMLDADAVSDKINTDTANLVLLGLLKGEDSVSCPCWWCGPCCDSAGISPSNLRAAAAEMRTDWAAESIMPLLRQPVLVHFLRAHLSNRPHWTSSAELLAVLDLLDLLWAELGSDTPSAERRAELRSRCASLDASALAAAVEHAESSRRGLGPGYEAHEIECLRRLREGGRGPRKPAHTSAGVGAALSAASACEGAIAALCQLMRSPCPCDSSQSHGEARCRFREREVRETELAAALSGEGSEAVSGEGPHAETNGVFPETSPGRAVVPGRHLPWSSDLADAADTLGGGDYKAVRPVWLPWLPWSRRRSASGRGGPFGSGSQPPLLLRAHPIDEWRDEWSSMVRAAGVGAAAPSSAEAAAPPSPTKAAVAEAGRNGLPGGEADGLARATSLLARAVQLGCDDFPSSERFLPCARYCALLRRRVGHDSFEHVRPIGRGGYGRVWASFKRDTGACFAVKAMSRLLIVHRRAERHVLDELHCLRAVRSPFVCALHYAYATPDSLCLVLEWLQAGSLQWHLKKRRALARRGAGGGVGGDEHGAAATDEAAVPPLPFSEAEAQFFAACIVLGLEALHKARVVYRDLKPDNLLLRPNGFLVLTDLGLAAPLDAGGRASGKVGTRGYWAPEMVSRLPYGVEVDFWSLGVTLHCLWAESAPFNVDAAARSGALGATPVPPLADREARKALQDQLILTHQPPPPGPDGRGPEGGLSEEARDFLRRLLTKEPAARLGAAGGVAELMAHSFFVRGGGGGEGGGGGGTAAAAGLAATCWSSMRDSTAAPPMLPSSGEVNATSIAQVGATAAVPAGVTLTEEHHARFAGWEYVDTARAQAEVLETVRRREEGPGGMPGGGRHDGEAGGPAQASMGVWGDLAHAASRASICATRAAVACCVGDAPL